MEKTIYQDLEVVGRISATDGLSTLGFGTCSTAPSTTAKTVAIKGFELVVGSRATVKFTTANTVSSPTLNINNTGAKPMKCGTLTTTLVWKAGEIMDLLYDGTNWCILNGYSLKDYPVGDYYVRFSGMAAPGARLGGTWTLDIDSGSYKGYAGKFLLGATTESEIGSTGGEATHTLTYTELPELTIYTGKYGASGSKVSMVSDLQRNVNPADTLLIAEQQGLVVGQPHNNMPPYKIIGIYKRTA